ncbi:MAG: glpG 2 [Schlesneria sp.]|nr:glpG 2 [Schlesneria sp.]
MRQIGSIEDRQQAERFVAYLIGKRIPSSFDGSDSSWRIWIQEEDDVATAKTELDQFRADPNHERYRNALAQAEIVLRQQLQQAKEISRRTIDLRERWKQPTVNQCPVTVGLLSLMTLAMLVQHLDSAKYVQVYLQFAYAPDGTLNLIRAGEVWRLVTPIFLHGNFLHFFFNALWLHSLGLLVESRTGSLKFMAMVLVIAVVSNSLEFVMTHSQFVGMSGVVYGLFGYAWIRGRLEPDSGLGLNRNLVTSMMLWFFLCIFAIQGVANWVHGGGLAMGALLGTVSPVIRYFQKRL